MTSEAPTSPLHATGAEGPRYVYAVVSRRSRGLSIGLNLSPDARCNFDCAYCQVDRRTPRPPAAVDEALLLVELDAALDRVEDGTLFDAPSLRAAPPELRRLRDLAFAGDGEPTAHPRFGALVERVAARSRARGLPGRGVKLVVLTNASLLHRAEVKRGLAALRAHGGEVWAKLDAGTEGHYARVNRTVVPLARVLANLLETARAQPIVIQTCVVRLAGCPPPPEEVEALAGRLCALRDAGGSVERVDLYTLARPPAEPWVAPLGAAELETIAAGLRAKTGLRVDTFG